MLALLASCESIKVPKAENALLYYGSWELNKAHITAHGSQHPNWQVSSSDAVDLVLTAAQDS